MSALERVARRIGMVPIDSQGMLWDDRTLQADGYRSGLVRSESLRDHLLTGDRPLRYFEALRKAGYRFVVRTFSDKVMILYVGPPQHDAVAAVRDGQFAEGATLDAAIIALAERIEGEGRE